MLVKKNNKIIHICMLILLVILFKISIESILPPKYFYDGKFIFDIAMNKSTTLDASYAFSGNIYKIIFNFFNIKDYTNANVIIAVVGNLLLGIYIIKNNINFKNIYYITFLIISLLFMNIYIFTVSKDLLQFIIYSSIFIILVSDKFDDRVKIISTSLILIISAKIFRTYIIGVLGFFIINYFSLFYKFNNSINLNKIMKFLICVTCLMLMFSIVMNSKYRDMVNIRHIVNYSRIDSNDAKTIILDILKNDNSSVTIFMINTMINIIRLLFPVELILKGYKYIPFIIYQIFISLSFLEFIKRDNFKQKEKFIISFVFAYYIVAAIFEPDFGSSIRHEMAIILFINYIVSKTNIFKLYKQVNV